MSETIQSPEGGKNRRTQIAVAVIAALAAIIAAYLKLTPEPGSKMEAGMIPSVERSRALTGRIVNGKTQQAVGNAKVSLEFAGAVPVLRYPDSEGIFDFATPSDTSSVRIRVEAPGFRIYDRHLNVTRASGIEEIRLEPTNDRTPQRPPASDRFTGNVPPVFQTPDPKPPAVSLVDESLPVISGGDAPWAVVIFGGHQNRRDDVSSWVRDALGGSGHETVSLFRKVSEEQRVAPDLYRGSNELMSRLDAGRYVSRILVAKFTVATVGTYEGLTTAEAKLAVHLLSPSGERLKSFEVSEKGAGLSDELAQSKAIDELKDMILRELPSSI